MFSQSLFAQLVRMSLLLILSLIVVHHSPTLLDLLAQQAVDSGCHQALGDQASHSHDHHH
ncbi:hypothetical protein QTN94_15650 [Vibrio sp. M250220]|uniref:hypothetical protein n=1 Tax=Vibrio sp. M250220 TaxID=3020894 RepID=UPI002F426985